LWIPDDLGWGGKTVKIIVSGQNKARWHVAGSMTT
jgi:hypothetical protein